MSGLSGQRVLITRAAEDCGPWAEQLRDAGAVPVILPCIACEIIDEPAVRARLRDALRSADWVVFTSRRGVEAFKALLGHGAKDIMPRAARVAVVGAATADAARGELGRLDLVAEAGTAESLAKGLACLLQGAGIEPASPPRLLIAVAANAGPVLEETLAAAGAACSRVDVYRTVPAGARRVKQALSDLGADKILLASPSAVTGLLNQVEFDTTAEIFTIGPSTSRAVRAAELTVTAEARRPNLQGLMETMT